MIIKLGDAYPNKYGSCVGRIYSYKGDAPTVRTPTGGGTTPMISMTSNTNAIIDSNGHPCVWNEKCQCYVTVRKLTPKECFRLQGWPDEMFERAQLVNSDSQLYRQAGNGVSVPCVYEIAKRL